MNEIASGPKGMKIVSCDIIDSDGNSVNALLSDREYVISIRFRAEEDVTHVSVGYNIKLASGIIVYGTSTAIQGHFLDLAQGEAKTTRFSFKPKLALGTYYLSVGLAKVLSPEDEIHNYVMEDFAHDALPFVVGSPSTSGIAMLDVKLSSFTKS